MRFLSEDRAMMQAKYIKDGTILPGDYCLVLVKDGKHFVTPQDRLFRSQTFTFEEGLEAEDLVAEIEKDMNSFSNKCHPFVRLSAHSAWAIELIQTEELETHDTEEPTEEQVREDPEDTPEYGGNPDAIGEDELVQGYQGPPSDMAREGSDDAAESDARDQQSDSSGADTGPDSGPASDD